MTFNHHALIARIGNELGAREEFARLVAALAALTTRVRRIRENPGDWGIDCFAGQLDEGADVAVWQAKFFITSVGDSQQQQIRDSFAMARDAAAKRGYRVARWTLAIPIDLSAAETKWWDGWKKRQEKESGFQLVLWDKHHLDELLRVGDAEAIRDEFFPPFAVHAASSRPIEPLPADTTYDDMLFIAQLREAGIVELQAARSEFFNAELLVRDVSDKGLDQELECLRTIRSEAHSLWSHEFTDACEMTDAGHLPGLHGAVMRALREIHHGQGPTQLRLSVVHRFGTMHQIAEDGEAGWVRYFRDVARKHRNG